MSFQDDGSFWSQWGPGLFSTGVNAGVNLYGMRQGRKEADARLRAENPALYNQLTQAAQGQLALAGNADPAAIAKQRFEQQQELLRPLREKQEAELMSSLRGRGMLGISNYQGAGTDPISKTTQTWAQAPGVAVNPHIAAWHAAQAGQQSKDAYAAQAEGDKRVDQILARAGALSGAAQHAQPSGRVQDQALKAKYGLGPTLLRGAADIFKQNPAVIGNLFSAGAGLFKDGLSWLRGPTAAAPSLFDDYFDYGDFNMADSGFGDVWL
jgi:hypothetical protein